MPIDRDVISLPCPQKGCGATLNLRVAVLRERGGVVYSPCICRHTRIVVHESGGVVRIGRALVAVGPCRKGDWVVVARPIHYQPGHTGPSVTYAVEQLTRGGSRPEVYGTPVSASRIVAHVRDWRVVQCGV